MRTSLLALILATLLPTVANAAMTVQGVAGLIRHAEHGAAEPQGWARDMLDVLDSNGLGQGKENICASIAVIDQESNFNANPVVPGLGTMSEAALRDRLGGYPIVGSIAARFLENSPSTDDSYMSRIREARTERDLDLVYRTLVADAASRAGLEVIVGLGLFNRAIDARNEISTAGSMQVSVRFALDEANRRRFLPMSLSDTYAVRDELYTRRGGMDYGILRLLGYETGYDKKIFRFADYNAGRYASRNAAFQNVITALTGQQLVPDGDLLLYKDGKPRSKASASEKALRKILAQTKPDQIRKDLLSEKSADFVSTQTFVKTRELFRTKFRRDPPFAAIPDISLHSIKISHPMKTANFAESVNRRYQACMATPE